MVTYYTHSLYLAVFAYISTYKSASFIFLYLKNFFLNFILFFNFTILYWFCHILIHFYSCISLCGCAIMYLTITAWISLYAYHLPLFENSYVFVDLFSSSLSCPLFLDLCEFPGPLPLILVVPPPAAPSALAFKSWLKVLPLVPEKSSVFSFLQFYHFLTTQPLEFVHWLLFNPFKHLFDFSI